MAHELDKDKVDEEILAVGARAKQRKMALLGGATNPLGILSADQAVVHDALERRRRKRVPEGLV